ncbi:MAG: AsmA family protein [Rubrivivax sp.]
MTTAADASTRSPWLRRSLIALGALLLVVIAAAVLIATFDARRFKVLAVDWMRDTHQRTLAIDGPIELSVFPRLSVKVSKLRLSERASSDPFLAVDGAELAVRVLPLLKKQLVVDRISARGVQANYRRAADGVRNIDDLIAAENAADPVAVPEASASAATGSALAFDVSAVHLQDVRLTVHDETAPLAGELNLQSFTSGRLAPGLVTPVTLKAMLKLQQPQAVALQIEGSGNLSLELRRSAMSMGGMSLTVAGDSAGLTGLQAQLDGDLAWDGQAVQAGPLKLALQSATWGALGLQPSTLDLGRALYSPAAQRIELRDLKLALAGQQGQSPFKLELDWPKLQVDGSRIEGSALSGRAELGGAQTLDATFQTAAPAGDFETVTLPGLAATLKTAIGPRRIDGKLKGNLQFSTGGKAPAGVAIEHLVLSAAVADSGLAPLQLSMRGRMQGSAKAAGWALNGTLNSNRFETSGTADLAGPRPRVELDGRFDSLDLNTLLAPQTPSVATAATAATAVNTGQTPIDLAPLRLLDGRFDLSAGGLAFRQYRVADARLQASLDNGKLQLSRLTGKAWGGSVQASGSADAASSRVALIADANGVDIGALLKTVADKDLLVGTGRVTADVQTTGTTLAAMRSALAGSAALQVRDGAVKGFNIAKALRQAKAAIAGRVDSDTRSVATEQTDFSEMNVSARIAGGVATSDDLELKSPFLRIGGAGRFDIGKGRIDYTARATVIGSSKGQGGAELDALRGVTVPVRLTGPFEAVDWKIVWSEIAAKAIEQQLKNRVRDKLSELLGSKAGSGAASAADGQKRRPEDVLKDELKDRLRGLFK